ARKFARGLSLKTGGEWRDYARSDKKPADIPVNPRSVYAKTGWAGMSDWLGTGAIATHLRQYRSFEDARAFVRSLGLKSGAEWWDYAKSDKKPADIPVNSRAVYAKAR